MLAQINWKPEKRDVRKSGLGILIGAAAVFCILVFALDKLPPASGLKIFGPIALAGLLTALMPGVFRFVYFVWMGLAYGLGRVVSPVILSLFYFAFITPYALVLRLFRKSPLNLKDGNPPSFWEDFNKEITKENFERQS
jgi:hypothetical protein